MFAPVPISTLVLACVAYACLGRRTLLNSEGLQSSEMKQSLEGRSALNSLATYLLGGWSGSWSKLDLLDSSHGEHDSPLEVWNQVIAKTPTHEGYSLAALGKPIVVKTQVVAGTNYMFGFQNGAVVAVFHQPWSGTLEVSSISDDPTMNQKRYAEWSQESLTSGTKSTENHAAPTSMVELRQSSSNSQSSLNKALAMFLTGGWSNAGLLESTNGERHPALDVWDQVLAKTPNHDGHDLTALGRPIIVKKQVVAGTNYMFGFENGATVVVFHQPWTGTLEVSKVSDDSATNQVNLKEWQAVM